MRSLVKFIIAIGMSLILLIGQRASANWYAGTERPTSYGISASIRTPSNPLQMIGATGESNWVAGAGPNWSWIQAGWIFYGGQGTPVQYVEGCPNNCNPRYYMEYNSQTWGTYVEYLVEYKPGTSGTWCAYVAGVQKRCEYIGASSTSVQAYSEIHSSPQNPLDTTFNPVRYKDASMSWILLNQNVFVADFPMQFKPFKTIISTLIEYQHTTSIFPLFSNREILFYS